MRRVAIAMLSIGVIGGCTPIPAERVLSFADHSEWLLLADLPYQLGDTAEVVVVRAGFVTDYASIPRAFCQLLPQQGRHSRAAIVHDYLYWRGECSREQADRIMYLAMTESGVRRVDRDAIFRAIRRFGEPAWDDNRADRDAGLPRVIPEVYREIPDNRSWPEYREFLRSQGAPLDPKDPIPPAYCARADQLFDEMLSRPSRWWELWKR